MDRYEKESTLRVRYSTRVGFLLTLCLAVVFPAIAVAQQQPPEPAEQSSEQSAPPAPPTDEEKNAALAKIGITNPGDIPSPTENPAAAARMVLDRNEALANPDPPEEPDSEPVELIDYDPRRSYSRLLYPSIAARVGLSGEQINRVNALMTERAQRLANAPKEEWNQITIDSEKALKAILTPEQDERFQRGISQKTIVLRFNKERWADVLTWFASECGLQLVMSAPPQGTFTYSDKTAYSPKDALDIINGYLNFKGYTLIRYNAMLILHDFKTGAIPLQFLPKITPEDLPNQSRFDYVALTIPLEQRGLNAVRQTIQPFQGPHSVIRVQGGNSIMVVDSVNALREIYEAAMSVYNPDPPRQRPDRGGSGGPQRAPETPEWRSYELDSLAYATVRDQLEVFAPDAKPLFNPESNVVNYLCVPSLHNVIEGLLERLKEGADPAKAVSVRIYSLDKIASASGPEVWSMDRRSGRQYGGGLGSFGSSGGSDLAQNVVESLETLAPDAQIQYNPAARNIFVVATPADHKKISTTLANLEAEPAVGEEPVVKVYHFKNQRSNYVDNSILTMLRVVTPLAQPLPTSDGSLLVVATAEEQEKVAKALEEYEASAESPDRELVLRSYVMTSRQVQRFNQIFSQISWTPEMRGAVRVMDPVLRTRFAIYATPEQQKKIAKIIDEIVNADAYINELKPQGLPEPQEPESDSAPETSSESSDAEEAPPASAASDESAEPASTAPETTSIPSAAEETPTEKTTDDESSEPASTAPETTSVPSAVEETPTEKTPSDEDAEPASTAPEATSEPSAVVETPTEKTTSDEDANDVASVLAALERAAAEAARADAEKALAADGPQPFTSGNAYMAVIPTRRVSVSSANTFLINMVPGLDVIVDYSTPALIVYGPRSAVVSAIQLVERLDSQLDYVLEIVELEKELPTEVVSALPRIEPRVLSTYDKAKSRLLLAGKPSEVERLKKYVDHILDSVTDEKESVYYLDVERDVPAEILDYIRRAVPGVELTYDSSSRRFTLIGTPTEQLATAKLINDAIVNLPPEDETRYYKFDEQVSDRMIELLKERVKQVSTIERDPNNSGVLRVVAKPYQHAEIAEAIEYIQNEYPLDDENTFVSYKTTKELRDRFDLVKDDFEKKHGSIKIFQDDSDNTFAVWALPAQHTALKALFEQLSDIQSGEKQTAALYRPRRVDAATLVAILKDLQPDLVVTNDTLNERLILRGLPEEIEEARATLAVVDADDTGGVTRFFRAYPIQGFYGVDGVGRYFSPSYYVRDISALVPAARITYDYYNQQLVVWGTEEEHEIVSQAVDNLTKNTEVDKRIMRWQIRRADYSTLRSQIVAVYPDVIPSYDYRAGAILVRAPNSASLDAVKELLELLDPEEVSEFDQTLQYYDVGAAPSPQLVDAVELLVPNAPLVQIDKKTQQLLVIGKPAEQKVVADNIEKLARTYGSSDLRMIPYPVYGMRVDDLVTSMTEAYPAATFTEDTRGSRMLVRATLDDHVKISAEIARINEEAEDATGETTSVGPRVVVYEVDSQQIALQVRGVVMSLFPEAEVFGGGGYGGYGGYGGNQKQKVTVLANGREQAMIRSIVESLGESTEEELEFAIYPYGEIDEQTADAIVGNLVPEAIAIEATVGPVGNSQMMRNQRRQQLYMQRQSARQMRGSQGQSDAPFPFYRVDPVSKTVALLATEEQHALVRSAIEKLSMITEDGGKTVSKVYKLGVNIAYQLSATVSSVYPSCTATPTSGFEIIVVGPEAEMEKVDAMIEAINKDEYDKLVYPMQLLTLPPDSKYNRDRLVSIINGNFSPVGVSAYPGAVSDQIITWAPPAMQERVKKFFDAIVTTPADEVFKTYPIRYTDIGLAVSFLSKVCPNLEITPDYPRRAVVVFGSPDQQAVCAKALEDFDQPEVEGAENTLATYDWADPSTFWGVFAELRANFPGELITTVSNLQFVITASKATQDKIGDYLKRRAESLSEYTFVMKAYYLQRVNLTRVAQLVPSVLPRVYVYPGKGANEIFVVGSKDDHTRFQQLLAAMESVPEDEDEMGLMPRIYKISTYAASLAIELLQPQLPGVTMYPITNERIVVWGGLADQEYVEKTLGVISEAFPPPVLRKYQLIYLRVNDVLQFCQARYYGQASFWPSSSGDLMCQASEALQEEVAKMIAELDVEESAESRFVPVAYDLSDVPEVSHPTVVANLVRIAPEAIPLPSATPGFIIVYARPSVQKRVGELVDELIKERDSGMKSLVAYTVRRMSYAQISQLLLPLYPNIKIGLGTTADQIVILAKPAEHEKIAELVKQLNSSPSSDMTSRVYRLKNSQLWVAQNAIMTMFPQAVVVIDQMSRSVLVKAYDDEHEKIAQLITEIDEKDPERNTSFKVFNIGNMNFYRLLTQLRNFYSGDPGFQVQLDNVGRCLIVHGTAIQHDAVEKLIEEVRAGGLADPESYMQTYTLKSQSALMSLYEIFWEQGREINMYRDYSTGKLVVIGRPEEHKMVEDILELVAPEETELAVFDLLYVDPQAARQVFSMLETDGSYIDVRLDVSSNQLYVRSTPAKLEEIRQLLIKMGETDLEKMRPFAVTSETGAVSTDGRKFYLRDNEKRQQEIETQTPPVEGSDFVDIRQLQPIGPPKLTVEGGEGRIRTVTIPGGDANKALEAALKAWELDNPIHVIEGDQGIVQEKDEPTPAPQEAPKTLTPQLEEKSKALAPQLESSKGKAPTTETPKALAPQLEDPKVEAPTTETPKALTPQLVDPKVEAPATETPKALTPQLEGPKVEAPTTETPKALTPQVEEPKGEAPAMETPKGVVPRAELPQFDSTVIKEIAGGVLSVLLSLDRPGLTTEALFLNVDEDSAPSEAPVADPTSADEEPEPPADEPVASADQEDAAPASAGIYIVKNPDGTLLVSSNDPAALEEFQKKLAEAVESMALEHVDTGLSDTSDASSESPTIPESGAADDETTDDSDNSFTDPTSRNFLSYMTPENIAEARKRVLLESRTYTVYKVENVGVSQIVPQLQMYLGDRINRQGQSRFGGYGYDPYGGYGYGTGVNILSINQPQPVSFQPNVANNTLMVYGPKGDREAVGAMLVVLDDVELFPQPITKPYKIKIVNTSPNRMAQQVLSAFSRKFQTTLMPGNLTPRITPNPATNSLEVYAPDALAKEIEEYVQEVDKEILEESIRKVRVIELQSINSNVLARYLMNLGPQQTPLQNFSMPYIGGGYQPTPYMQGGMNQRYNAANRARYNTMQGAAPYGRPGF